MKKIISLLIVTAMLATALCSCGAYNVAKLNLDEYVKLGNYNDFTADEFAERYESTKDENADSVQSSYNVDWGYSVEFNLECQIVTTDGDKTTYTKYDKLCYEGDSTAKINIYENTLDAYRCSFDSAFIYNVDDATDAGSATEYRNITVGTPFSFTIDAPYDSEYAELRNQTVQFTVTPIKVWTPLYADDEIADYLDEFLDEHSATQTILAKGDQVYADITATVDGVQWDDSTMTSHLFMLGYSQWVREFDNALVGHKVGETITFSAAFPSDWDDETVAGKTVDFSVYVRSAVNYDRAISENSEYASLYEYKEALRVSLYASYEIVSLIADRSELINMPEELLKQFQKLFKNQADTSVKSYVATMGGTEDDAKEYLFGDVDGYEEYINESAESSAYETLVVYALLDKLNLLYTDEMYADDLQTLTDNYNSYYETEYTAKQFEKTNGELLLKLVFIEEIICNDRVRQVEGLAVTVTTE